MGYGMTLEMDISFAASGWFFEYRATATDTLVRPEFHRQLLLPI